MKNCAIFSPCARLNSLRSVLNNGKRYEFFKTKKCNSIMDMYEKYEKNETVLRAVVRNNVNEVKLDSTVHLNTVHYFVLTIFWLNCCSARRSPLKMKFFLAQH